MRQSWVQDAQLAAEETRRRAQQRQSVRQAATVIAFDMRADGHTLEEIRDRTGVPMSTLGKLFRGLGRRA